MTWTAFQWVWRLESPLFVGMPPAGALNRCRLYVPARVIWGAVTAEMSRSTTGESFPDYNELKRQVELNCRFTYLFPAEKRGQGYRIWLPQFEKCRGLLWYRHGDGERLSDRDFRRLLLDFRPGTAITPESDSASEGTLRETECISPWWRDFGHQEGLNAVLLLGYVFLRNNRFRTLFDNIDTLFVGGDTRYGLGKICRVGWHEISDDLSIFGKRTCLDGEHPSIESDIVFGHACESGQEMQGAKELLGGWDQGRPWRGTLAWAPGSSLEGLAVWSIDQDGFWSHHGEKSNGHPKDIQHH